MDHTTKIASSVRATEDQLAKIDVRKCDKAREGIELAG